MRVFYPISTRLSEIVNSEGPATSGWMVLWSIFSVAMPALLLTALFSIEAGATKAGESLSDHEHVAVLAQKGNDPYVTGQRYPSGKAISKTATQEYIDAYRYAQFIAQRKTGVTRLPKVAPIKSKVSGGRYL